MTSDVSFEVTDDVTSEVAYKKVDLNAASFPHVPNSPFYYIVEGQLSCYLSTLTIIINLMTDRLNLTSRMSIHLTLHISGQLFECLTEHAYVHVNTRR